MTQPMDPLPNRSECYVASDYVAFHDPPKSANSMSNDSVNLNFGFLTCTEIEGLGVCGGLLILNQSARPLEFHCTLPVKINAVHATLYGASLESYLRGELLGQALAAKPKVPPHVFVTDCGATAEVRSFCERPVCVVRNRSEATELSANASGEWLDWACYDLAHQEIFLAPQSPQLTDDAGTRLGPEAIRSALSSYAERHDLMEPFDRVRQAMIEAHQAARRAA